MKYVLLGKLSPDFLTQQERRTTTARAKLKQLGIKLESVHYTQGAYDFVDVVETADPLAMLAFSVWYGEQGYGSLVSMPAFAEREMVKALRKGGLRRKAGRK